MRSRIGSRTLTASMSSAVSSRQDFTPETRASAGSPESCQVWRIASSSVSERSLRKRDLGCAGSGNDSTRSRRKEPPEGGTPNRSLLKANQGAWSRLKAELRASLGAREWTERQQDQPEGSDMGTVTIFHNCLRRPLSASEGRRCLPPTIGLTRKQVPGSRRIAADSDVID
jgi:hypothetical protein